MVATLASIPGTPEYFQGLWGDRNTANFDDVPGSEIMKLFEITCSISLFFCQIIDACGITIVIT